jgi:hypothetical protein
MQPQPTLTFRSRPRGFVPTIKLPPGELLVSLLEPDLVERCFRSCLIMYDSGDFRFVKERLERLRNDFGAFPQASTENLVDQALDIITRESPTDDPCKNYAALDDLFDSLQKQFLKDRIYSACSVAGLRDRYDVQDAVNIATSFTEQLFLQQDNLRSVYSPFTKRSKALG